MKQTHSKYNEQCYRHTSNYCFHQQSKNIDTTKVYWRQVRFYAAEWNSLVFQYVSIFSQVSITKDSNLGKTFQWGNVSAVSVWVLCGCEELRSFLKMSLSPLTSSREVFREKIFGAIDFELIAFHIILINLISGGIQNILVFCSVFPTVPPFIVIL